MLILRTCNPDMTSYNGFQWPAKGPVKAPDWKDDYRCGHGLHGLPWGEGEGRLLNWSPDAKWLVVSVPDDLIKHGQGDMVNKCKFPKGQVVYCGDQKGVTDYIALNGGQGKAIVGYQATAGNKGTATAGYKGTATAGNYGTATAGNYGTATAGDEGTATAGYKGTATAGNYGTATAGYKGTATAGNYGTATAGDEGTATAGDEGTLLIKYWDSEAQRYRIAMAYVGENGIKPNVQYRLNDNHEFVEVQ